VPVFLFLGNDSDEFDSRRTKALLEEEMERGPSLLVAKTNRRSCRKQRSVTAILVLLTSLLYAAFCEAQIIGTGQLSVARRSHTATLLQDGKILIVGGDDANGLVGHAEIFDPATLTSSNIAANPIALRTDHTATLLPDGRVLIIGGVDSNGLLTSTESYNPYSIPAPSFSAAPSLQRARGGHTATVLSDGKILIVGGESTGSAEIYDPASETFSLVAGSLNTPRQYHSAVLLHTGKVLIVGGLVGTNTTLTSAEIYDPQTQTFTPASGPMQTPRGFALLRVLPDGKVQIIGGDGEFSMEMFDPDTNSFIALAHIPPHEDYLDSIITSRTRSALITTIIQQNPVLQGQPELTAEFIALLNRLDHTVTEIPQSNRALIAGGVNDAGQILNSATVVSSSAATVTTDKFDYAPGEVVTITGNGFQPNETVWMLLHEEPETRDDTILSSVANNQGHFTNSEFAPALIDLNRNFTLTAIGASSGFTAQTAFKDSSNQISGIRFDPTNQPVSFTVAVPNGVTTPLGIQTVNALNNPETVTGNNSVIIQISSSSSTGRFDTNNGGTFATSSLTLTISQNNTSRTADFFYRDTAAGNVTLTATVTARTGQVPVALIGKTATITKTVNKANTTTTLNLLTGTNPSTYGDSLTFRATVAHATPGGAGTPAGNVEFYDGATLISTVALSGSTADLITSTLSVTGSPHSITARYLGDGNFNNSTSAGVSHKVEKATPVFTNLTGPTITFGDTPTTLSGTIKAGSLVPSGSVSITLNGVTQLAAIDAATGNFSSSFATGALGVAASPFTITYSYAGDANFNGAGPDTSKSLTILKATPTVSVTGGTFTYNGNPHAATGFAYGIGGVSDVLSPAVTFSYVGTGSTTYGPTATAPTNAGTYQVTASFAGNDNYTSASNTATITINKATQAITGFTPASPITYSPGGTFALSATGGASGNPVTFASTTPSVCTVSGSTATIVSAGTCSLTADQAGNGNYEAAPQVGANVVINKATPTATLAVSNSPQTYSGSPQAATVAISTSSVPGAVANILTGGAATQTAAGIYAVTADFVPNDTTNYNTLIGLSAGNFVILKATPTATLAVSNSPQTYNGSPKAATVSITTSSVPGSVANILTGGAATKTNAGTYAVTADFVPNDTTNYNTLIGLSAGNFVIQKATPIITWANPADITYPTALSATQLNATADVAGSFVYTPLAGTLLSVGSGQTLHVDFTPADSLNYNNASKNVLINVIYNFTGFFRPVDNLPVLNVVNAGSAIPVKFSLNGYQGLNILAGGYPVSQKIYCDTSAPMDDITETVTTGGSSLSYDATTDQYVYVWKTDKPWANTCRQLIVRLSDGTDHVANFKFKK
jgi:Bacterial Ig-like domain (group 3)/Galactose oxidase, central domain